MDINTSSSSENAEESLLKLYGKSKDNSEEIALEKKKKSSVSRGLNFKKLQDVDKEFSGKRRQDRRWRDKKEKSPSSSRPNSAATKQIYLSEEGSSVPEESLEPSTNDSHSSYTEELPSDCNNSVPYNKKEKSISENIQEVDGSKFNSSDNDLYLKSSKISTVNTQESADTNIEEQFSYSFEPTSSSTKSQTRTSKSSSRSTDTDGGYMKNRSRSSSTSLKDKSMITSSILEEVSNSGDKTTTKSNSEVVSSSEKMESKLGDSGDNSNSKSDDQRSLRFRKFPLAIKTPLSPHVSPRRHRRRYSSESDDSFTMSQNETASDFSDGEGKLAALKEQLTSRFVEAEKLRREKRRIKRERIASQEQALQSQIDAYDSYIQKTKLELDEEMREIQNAVSVRPLIKKPQVAESKKIPKPDLTFNGSEKSYLLDSSTVSESQSSVSSNKSFEKTNLEISGLNQESSPSKVQQQEKISEDSIDEKYLTSSKQVSEENKDVLIAEQTSLESNDFEADSSTTEQSEINSFTDKGTSTTIHSSTTTSTTTSEENSKYEGSSTETIVQSPKKSEQSILNSNQNYLGDESIKKGDKNAIKDDANEVKLQIYIPGIDEKATDRILSDQDTSIDESIEEDFDISEKSQSQVIIKGFNHEENLGQLELVIGNERPSVLDETKDDKTESLKAVSDKAIHIADDILKSLITDSRSVVLDILSRINTETSKSTTADTSSVDTELDADKTESNLSNSSTSSDKSELLKKVSNLITAEDRLSPKAQNLSGIKADVTSKIAFDLSPEVSSPKNATKLEDNSDSPSHDKSKAEKYTFDPDELTSKLLNLSEDDFENRRRPGENDGFDDADWFYDELWTPSSSGSQSSEHHLLQVEEQRIAAEIARLEELQRLQEQYPDLVIREVPDKPPPPYTPPSETTSPVKTPPTNGSPYSSFEGTLSTLR